MCQGVSDMLTLMFLMKLCGMVVAKDGELLAIHSCYYSTMMISSYISSYIYLCICHLINHSIWTHLYILGRIEHGPFDITGLFETVEDLKSAPRIMRELLSVPMLRNWIVEHREGVITVMCGYSDSVREGSSLASDAQVSRTTILIKELEDEINAAVDPTQRIRFVFYRGRGDTLPRGFGGSITKVCCV